MTAGPSGVRRRQRLLVLAAGLVTLVACSGSTPGASSPGGSPTGPGSGSPPVSASTSASPPSSSGSPCSGPYASVPTYFAKTWHGRSALYRVELSLETCDPEGPSAAEQAVGFLGSRAAEVAYESFWPTDLDATSFRVTGHVARITVNGDPIESTRIGLQQLVWTVTAADRQIRRVDLTTPGGSYPGLVRAPQEDVLAPVWLLRADTEDVSGGSVIHMSGSASVFEATVSWQVTSSTGKVVDSGSAMTPEAAPARGPWQASSQPLPAGRTYTVTAYAASPEDGSMTWPDSRTTS